MARCPLATGSTREYNPPSKGAIAVTPAAIGSQTHGPQAGRLEYDLTASLPKDRNKALASADELARKHGPEPVDVGAIG